MLFLQSDFLVLSEYGTKRHQIFALLMRLVKIFTRWWCSSVDECRTYQACVKWENQRGCQKGGHEPLAHWSTIQDYSMLGCCLILKIVSTYISLRVGTWKVKLQCFFTSETSGKRRSDTWKVPSRGEKNVFSNECVGKKRPKGRFSASC